MAQPSELEFAWFLISGVSITFLLALAIILFVVFYQKRLFAHQLRLKKIENEHRRSLLLATVQAQEKERKRIASDLHDEVGALLSTTKLYISHLEDSKNPKLLGDKIEKIIDSAQKNLKTILHNITPQNLEKFGLISSVNEVCERINEANLLQIDLAYNEERRLDLEKEIGVYRITQELLNNTIKHAGATQAWINFAFTGQEFQFTYQDNGKGMNLTSLDTQSKNGLGLQNLISRAELLDSRIDLQSAPDEGFRASLKLRLSNSH